MMSNIRSCVQTIRSTCLHCKIINLVQLLLKLLLLCPQSKYIDTIINRMWCCCSISNKSTSMPIECHTSCLHQSASSYKLLLSGQEYQINRCENPSDRLYRYLILHTTTRFAHPLAFFKVRTEKKSASKSAKSDICHSWTTAGSDRQRIYKL